MVSANDALQRLRDGNRRFVTGHARQHTDGIHHTRTRLAGGQTPFATILGCSDSRVPAELVFDQGLGDLFVIRVAGNIAAPSLIGSVEFAATHYGTVLVVVLGHSQCGAIHATIDALTRSAAEGSTGMSAIVNRVRPSVETLVAAGVSGDDLVDQAVRANVRMTASHLRHGSTIIEGMIQNNSILVVGAEYSLESGEVDFFDGVPAA